MHLRPSGRPPRPPPDDDRRRLLRHHPGRHTLPLHRLRAPSRPQAPGVAMAVAAFDSSTRSGNGCRTDTPFFAEQCLWIIDKRKPGHGPLEPNAEQLRFDQALEAQRLRGEPQRAIILKARQIGFSTWTQGKIIQRSPRTRTMTRWWSPRTWRRRRSCFGWATRCGATFPSTPSWRSSPRSATAGSAASSTSATRRRIEADAVTSG
jgi:hypothetical protein